MDDGGGDVRDDRENPGDFEGGGGGITDEVSCADGLAGVCVLKLNAIPRLWSSERLLTAESLTVCI